jgi:hypothetical protein
MADGKIWVERMTRTLECLDALCTRPHRGR